MEVVLKTWLPHLGCECDICRWTASHQKGACFFCQIGRWEGGGVEGHSRHGGLMADPLFDSTISISLLVLTFAVLD